MEAKNLRIGNYLIWGYNDDICRLLKVSENECAFLAVKKRESTYCDTDYLKPVKLNEYWLQGFGFKENEFSYNWENETRLSIYKAGDCFMAQIDNTTIDEIKYVHELQNLFFAFTKMELNADELVSA